jgi:hypothetical protein
MKRELWRMVSMTEEISLDNLDLSEDEQKHIEIRENGVSLRLPLKRSTGLDIDGESRYSLSEKRMCLESIAQARFVLMMTRLWDEEVDKGGTALKARLNGFSEAEFFKEATTEEEVRNAVLSLVRLKRSFNIA